MITLLLSFTACGNVIYDDEGNCSEEDKPTPTPETVYRLKFRYDMNMKYADAFAHEVKSVNVYAFDKSGLLVWQKAEKGSALAADGYAMKLDLEPGDYQLIAWCGLDNNAEDGESFSVPTMTVGQSRIEELQCKLNRKYTDAAQAYTDADLYPLYHGSLAVNLPVSEDGEERDYTMSLTKDTHHLRVILQHLSGKAVDVGDFTFTIEGGNGWLNYDNSLIKDEQIIYNAWNKEAGTVSSDTSEEEQTEAITTVNVAIADLTVGRMLVGDKLTLVIRNSSGGEVVRVPFIDYALLVKGKYNESMTDQEYLDRQDEYTMTFFLDEKDDWFSAYILIQSWRVVLSDHDLGEE